MHFHQLPFFLLLLRLSSPLNCRYILCDFCFLWFVFSSSEQCIEAYELLLALAESEQSLILGQFRAAGVGSVGKMSMSLFI